MEPSSLNSSEDKDAALAAMLRTHASTIPDDGFSARVLSALPPRPRAVARPAQLRWPWIAYLGGGVSGTVFAVARAGSWSDFAAGLLQLTNTLSALFATLTEPWLVIALMLATLSVAITLPFTRPQRRL